MTTQHGSPARGALPRLGAAALIIAGALLISACSSNKPVETEKVATNTTERQVPTVNPDPVRPQGETDEARLARIIALLAANPIYFDYNEFTVKQQYQAMLQKDFDVLRTMPAVQIRLEGNADERGSAEYNLALGQKRAEAVRRALGILGMPDANIEAVSFGKEKPKADCHEESCWAENRRVDFAVKR